MADHFIGINRNDNVFAAGTNPIIRGTSSGSTDVEIRIADAKSWTRNELIDHITMLLDEIVTTDNIAISKFPPK